MGWILALTILLIATAGALSAAVSVNLQTDIVSRYIWRGFDLNPDNRPALQPSMTFTIGNSGISINVWSSFAFGRERRSLHEIDITASYDVSVADGLDLSFGFTHYGWYFTDHFTFEDATSQEFFAALELAAVPLSPRLSVCYDIANGDGLYASLSAAHSMSITASLNVDISASVGYNAGQWIPANQKTGFSDLLFGVAVPVKTVFMTLTPFVNMAVIFLDSVNRSGTEVWFGLSVVI